MKVKVVGLGVIELPDGLSDEEMSAQIEARIKAGGPGAASATTTQPDASRPTPDPSMVSLQGGARPGAWGPQSLKETLKAMGEEMDPLSKLGSGVVESFERSARAIGLPHAIQAITGKPMDTEGEGFKGVSEGTGALGTIGNIAGSITQGVALGSKLAGALPASLKNYLLANPKIAAYLAGPVVAAGTEAIMTPGGPAERAKSAGIAAATTLPLTLAGRVFAQPHRMSELGKELQAATGEVPPLHIGAESKFLRDVGEAVSGVPPMSMALRAGEERVFDAGVRNLWQHATPPGKPNLLGPTGSSLDVKRGRLFEQLQTQFDDVYSSLLTGQRIPVTKADQTAVTRIIDNNLVPEDAARLHKILGKYFPKHQGTIGGPSWKELQEIVRSEAGKFHKSTSSVEKTMGETLDQIDELLIKMRNRGVSRNVAQKLDATDQAYASRKLVEKAIAFPEASKGLNPRLLQRALTERTSEGALARGHGVGQQVVDPLSAAGGLMVDPTTQQGLWSLRRLLSPQVLAASGLGAMVGGVPGALSPSMYGAAVNVIGSGRRGAKAIYGGYESQKAVADFLRNYPGAIPGGTAGLVSQLED